MLAEVFGSGDGLEVGLVVSLIVGVVAVQRWIHALDKRVSRLEHQVNPPNQSSVLPKGAP